MASVGNHCRTMAVSRSYIACKRARGVLSRNQGGEFSGCSGRAALTSSSDRIIQPTRLHPSHSFLRDSSMKGTLFSAKLRRARAAQAPRWNQCEQDAFRSREPSSSNTTSCEFRSPSSTAKVFGWPGTIRRRFSRFYDNGLQRHPLATKSLVIACGLATGDVLAQLISTGIWDPLRTFHMFSFGMLFQGPALHYFYTFLDSRVCPTNPTCPRAVITKTAADQLGMAPVGTVAFFAFMEICKGHPAGVAAAVSAGFFPTLKASYMIWPAAHLINFRFCPPDKRVLFVNFVSLAWSTILSLLSMCVVAQ